MENRRSFFKKVFTGAVGSALPIPGSVAPLAKEAADLGSLLAGAVASAPTLSPWHLYKKFKGKTLGEALVMAAEYKEAIDTAAGKVDPIVGTEALNKASDILYRRQHLADGRWTEEELEKQWKWVNDRMGETSLPATAAETANLLIKKARSFGKTGRRVASFLRAKQKAGVAVRQLNRAIVSLNKAHRALRMATRSVQLAQKSQENLKKSIAYAERLGVSKEDVALIESVLGAVDIVMEGVSPVGHGEKLEEWLKRKDRLDAAARTVHKWIKE